MSKSTTLTLSDGKEVEISLLPLRAYGEFLVALQDVFKEVADTWAGASNDDIISMLPKFIAEHIDTAAQLIAIGTRGQVTATEVADERGLADAIDLLVAVVEVNDVERIVGTVKKAMATFRAKSPQKTGSPTASSAPAAN